MRAWGTIVLTIYTSFINTLTLHNTRRHANAHRDILVLYRPIPLLDRHRRLPRALRSLPAPPWCPHSTPTLHTPSSKLRHASPRAEKLCQTCSHHALTRRSSDLDGLMTPCAHAPSTGHPRAIPSHHRCSTTPGHGRSVPRWLMPRVGAHERALAMLCSHHSSSSSSSISSSTSSASHGEHGGSKAAPPRARLALRRAMRGIHAGSSSCFAKQL